MAVSGIDSQTLGPLQAWGLTPDSAVAIGGGYRALNWDVQAGGARYFLKRYRAPSPEAVLASHRHERMFAQAGIPTFLPRPALNGETVVEDEGSWALYPFVHGQVLEKEGLTHAHGQRVGEMLGRIHTAGEAAAREVGGSAPPSLDREAFREKLQALLAQAEQGDSDFDRLAAETLAYKLRLSEQHLPPPPLAPGSPIIHGDYHEANLFFKEREISHVFDWERAAPGNPRVELARVVMFSGLDKQLRDPGGVGRGIIQGYQRAHPLTREELEEGFNLFFRKQAYNAWVEEFHYLEGSRKSDHFLAFNSTLLRSLERRRAQTARMLLTSR